MGSKCIHNFYLRGLLIVFSALMLASCSMFSSKAKTKEAETLPPLDVPPDLIRPYSEDKTVKPLTSQNAPQNTAKECQCDDRPPKVGEAVLPPGKGVTRLKDGQHHWLLVAVEPEQLWPLARKFLEMRGYQVSRDEPAVGLMETDWKKRFDESDGKMVSDSQERLRIRIEPGQQPGSTEVYLSQYLRDRIASADDAAGEKWKLRESDNERAVEMLNRFASFLAGEKVEEATPLTPMKSRMDSDGDNGSVLLVEADLEKVWRRTAIALDALGFVIEDRDRASRDYRVYHELPTGKTEEELRHGKPESATVREEYRVHLEEKDSNTLVSVRNDAGQVDNSEVALHLLNLLHSQFQ